MLQNISGAIVAVGGGLLYAALWINQWLDFFWWIR